MRATVLGVMVLLAVGARARGAENLEQARAYFQAGVDAYDEGKYEVALREFQHAYSLSHNPELYFNMAACEEHMNHYQAGSLLLRQYLIEKPNADDRSKVETRIKSLEEREDSLHRLPDAPPPRPMVVPPPPPPAKPNYTGGYVMLGVTGAFAITTIALGAYTASTHSSLSGGCGKTPQGCTSSQIDGMHATAVATDAFIGFTAVAAVVTVILFVYEAKHPPGRRAWLPRSTGGALGWVF